MSDKALARLVMITAWAAVAMVFFQLMRAG
jgi:hypothetical protein